MNEADSDRRLVYILETIRHEANRATIGAYVWEKRGNSVKPGTLLNDANAPRDLAASLARNPSGTPNEPTWWPSPNAAAGNAYDATAATTAPSGPSDAAST